jgi:hypothetical protein
VRRQPELEAAAGHQGVLRIEVGQPRPGANAVLARLADILLTQAIRNDGRYREFHEEQ